MATGKYNGFEGKFRDAQHQTQKELMKMARLPKAKECRLCKQTEGLIVWHNEDYNFITDINSPMCFMCHMMWHCTHSGTYEFRSEDKMRTWFKYQHAVQYKGFKQLLEQRNVSNLFAALNRGEYVL